MNLQYVNKVFFIPTIKKDNIEVPFYLKIKGLRNFKIDNHELSDSNLEFQLYMNLELNNYKIYNYYLGELKLYMMKQLYSNNFNYLSYNKDISNSNKDISELRTCIENTDEIKIFQK